MGIPNQNRTTTGGLWLALAGYVTLFTIKLGAFLVTHVGVMFAEAMHSLADTLISAFLLMAAYLSQKPADDEYRFGYGRAQNIAALVAATIFISFTSLETLREAIPRLVAGHEPSYENLPLALAVIVVSIAISAVPLVRLRKEKGAATKAQLIESVNDEVALFAALAGVVLVTRGLAIADALASVAVALIIAVNAALLWRENARDLMGRSPHPGFYEEVRRVAMSTPGVLNVHGIMAEQVGGQIHLGLHIEVARGILIEQADRIADTVHDEVCKLHADMYCVVHVDAVLDGGLVGHEAGGAAPLA